MDTGDCEHAKLACFFKVAEEQIIETSTLCEIQVYCLMCKALIEQESAVRVDDNKKLNLRVKRKPTP